MTTSFITMGNYESMEAQITSFRFARTRERVDIYLACEDEKLKKLFLYTLDYFNIGYFGSPSPLVTFFQELSRTPCQNHNHKGRRCVDSPEQKEAFKLLPDSRRRALVNSDDIQWAAGWPELLAVLSDFILAELTFFLRDPLLRKRLLKGFTPRLRRNILQNITELQRSREIDKWMSVVTPDFGYDWICPICKKGTESGNLIMKKPYSQHPAYMYCHMDKFSYPTLSKPDWKHPDWSKVKYEGCKETETFPFATTRVSCLPPNLIATQSKSAGSGSDPPEKPSGFTTPHLDLELYTNITGKAFKHIPKRLWARAAALGWRDVPWQQLTEDEQSERINVPGDDEWSAQRHVALGI
ncbi:hypothetical protein EJ08DRAFT_656369 [Tothia fuscella]|uniref:Uncharacterized protein n=1 Tax=Tothia fuscella TaxID=1048955 RepID=A0A9P4P202_9PEZI|nr:hypothetical protein EJ08DRAFT_656369 [Tothia fuscella]